jgi:hypothetical protein
LFGDKEILNLSSSSLPISLNKNMVEQNKKTCCYCCVPVSRGLILNFKVLESQLIKKYFKNKRNVIPSKIFQ